MIEYIRTHAPDGTPIAIEVEATPKPGTGFGRQPTPTDVSSEASKDAYNQIMTTIRACADGIVDTLQNLNAPPSAASVDFAIKVDAETGAMVAKSFGDAQFKISLNWKQIAPESKQTPEAGEAEGAAGDEPPAEDSK